MTEQEVEAALNKVRPTLVADGGDVELVDIKDGVVQVRLKGACSTCPMSQMTLKMGVEKLLKAEFPNEVKEVVAAYHNEAMGC
ncbi:MAG: NifU family protein [Deltaproteobacteria bacterium]|jgi:Fe-S cluster biogenesis protein NfuA|nr:NifU family protein [Deltaproteobacteria bacterium]